jgi:cytochrome c553
MATLYSFALSKGNKLQHNVHAHAQSLPPVKPWRLAVEVWAAMQLGETHSAPAPAVCIRCHGRRRAMTASPLISGMAWHSSSFLRQPSWLRDFCSSASTPLLCHLLRIPCAG